MNKKIINKPIIKKWSTGLPNFGKPEVKDAKTN